MFCQCFYMKYFVKKVLLFSLSIFSNTFELIDSHPAVENKGGYNDLCQSLEGY